MNRLSRHIRIAKIHNGDPGRDPPAAVFTAFTVRLAVFCIFLVVAGFGCGKDNDCPSCICICNCQSDYSSAVVMTPSLSSLTSVSYTVDSVSVAGRHLFLGIKVSGGCDEHCYRLYLDESFAESNPVQTQGYLVHVSNDPCEALLYEDLEFDLQPLIDHHRTVYGGDAPIIIKIYPNDRRDGELIAVRYEP